MHLFSNIKNFSQQDLFHIGDISATMGNSFSCADPDLWYNTPQFSRSGLSNVRQTVTYDYLVNTEGSIHTLCFAS
jgi:hypothetical protein